MLRLPAVALVGALALAGCAQTSPTGSAVPTSSAGAILVARGHGWTQAGIDGPIPGPGSCHMRAAANGAPLPDPACTPGALDQTVADSNIGTTICRKGGYTGSVRPPDTLSEPVKRKLLAAYGIPPDQIAEFELDHLVPLNAGGASDVRNLWPEPNTFRQFRPSSSIHNDKDAVETYTFHAVCAGKVRLSAVRIAMARDWTTAVEALGLPPIPADYQG